MLELTIRDGKDVMGIKPSSSKSLKESYPPTFYLNTADPPEGCGNHVNPGDEIPSVDFLLKPTHVVTVRGKVLNTISSRADGNVGVTLMSRGMVGNDLPSENAEVWNKEGRFEFRDVFQVRTSSGPGGVLTKNVMRARREVEVGDADVEGVNLTNPRAVVDVPGHVAWEENPPTEVQSIRVALRATDRGPYSWNSGASKPSRTELLSSRTLRKASTSHTSSPEVGNVF